METKAIKRQKQWGPVQPTRQSTRVDRSKNILARAVDLKNKSNLEVPNLKGIMLANPFSVFSPVELEVLSDKIGVVVNDSAHDVLDDSHSLIATSSGPRNLDEEADGW